MERTVTTGIQTDIEIDRQTYIQQRQVLRKSIRKTGGNWPITNSDLANKYPKFFQRFVNTINFESL